MLMSDSILMMMMLMMQVPALVQEILYLTAVLNTCTNPLIYGVYYFSENSGGRGDRRLRSVQC